jgi:hypothetical protein
MDQYAALKLAAEHLKPQQVLLLARTPLAQPVVGGSSCSKQESSKGMHGCPNQQRMYLMLYVGTCSFVPRDCTLVSERLTEPMPGFSMMISRGVLG